MTSADTRPFLRSAGRLATSAGAGILLLGASAFAQDKDTIQLKDGKSDTGLVKSEDYSGLAWTPSKGPGRNIEWKEIKADGIVYGSSPEFVSAKEALDAGKLPDALAKFDEMLADAKLRPVLKQNALYYAAAIHQRQGEWDKAIEGYNALTAAFPKSRWLMEVGEAIVACYVGKKDVAGAGKALDKLSTEAVTGGVDASFGSAVNVLKGRLFEEQGKFPEALAAYGVAEKASGVPAAVVQQARLGQARCFVAANRKPEAEVMFRKLTSEDAANPVLAGAWNGLGDLARDDGAKARDAEKLLDALYYYLRGVVQYAPLPGEPMREYRRSMQGSYECFKLISDLEKNPDRKRQYAERARERMAQLQKEFPQ